MGSCETAKPGWSEGKKGKEKEREEEIAISDLLVIQCI